MDGPVFFIALGAIVAGFVQGLSGFAFSLVAISFWAWTVEPKLAAALAVFGGLSGQIIAALTVRRGFDLRLLLPFLIGGIAGIPIGVFFLGVLDVDLFKALLGALLIVWCPLMLFCAAPSSCAGRRTFRRWGFRSSGRYMRGTWRIYRGCSDVVVQLARNGKEYPAQHHPEFQFNDLGFHDGRVPRDRGGHSRNAANVRDCRPSHANPGVARRAPLHRLKRGDVPEGRACPPNGIGHSSACLRAASSMEPALTRRCSLLHAQPSKSSDSRRQVGAPFVASS